MNERSTTCGLIFWGTRVWSLGPVYQYQNPTGYITGDHKITYQGLKLSCEKIQEIKAKSFVTTFLLKMH